MRLDLETRVALRLACDVPTGLKSAPSKPSPANAPSCTVHQCFWEALLTKRSEWAFPMDLAGMATGLYPAGVAQNQDDACSERWSPCAWGSNDPVIA